MKRRVAVCRSLFSGATVSGRRQKPAGLRIAVFGLVCLLTGFVRCGELPLTAAALSPSKDRVLLGSAAGIEIRSWPEMQPIDHWLAESWQLEHLHGLSFAPDGQSLLVVGGAPAEEGVVVVLSWPDGRIKHRVAAHRDVVYQAAWMPDGRSWITASADHSCGVFDSSDGSLQRRWEQHSRPVLSVCCLPDSERVVSVSVDQTVREWHSGTLQQLRVFDNHVDTVLGLALRPNSSADPVLATWSADRTVRLWQLRTGRMMRFARLAVVPGSVSWTDDGQQLVAGCHDGRIRILNPETVEVTADLEGLAGRIQDVVVDSERRYVLVVGIGGFRVVEM